MDFGALPATRAFDTTLAPLQARPGAPADSLEIRIGAAQWSVPSWVGPYYPKGTKGADQLLAYANQWNAIELNTSFYQIPSPEQVELWAAKTPEDFRFFVKLFQGISHAPEAWANLSLSRTRLAEFLKSWTRLENRTGGFFLQLPPDFAANNFGLLSRWLSLWPRELPLAVEFRHPSWFRDRNLKPEIFDFLSERRIGTSIVDTPGRRDVSHGSLTNRRLFVRFLTQSTEEHAESVDLDLLRLEAWAKWVADAVQGGIQQVAFFPHAPDQYWAPYFSTRFAELLDQELAARSLTSPHPRRPARLLEPQLSLF